MLVVGPATSQRASARASVASAASRSSPHTTSLASIGSYQGETSSPARKPVSTRTRASVSGMRQWTMRPIDGRKPRSGSSA